MKQNSSPGTLDLIMHATSELTISLASYNLSYDFQTECTHKINNWFFVFIFIFSGGYKMAASWGLIMRISKAMNTSRLGSSQYFKPWTVSTIRCIDMFDSAFGVTPASEN